MKNKTKYLILISIFISTFFSSISTTNAGGISEILNIDFGVEKIEYKLSELPDRNFENSKLQEKYTQMQIVNKVLTKEFYKEYKKGNIDYYTTKGIIKNHQNFIYQTSKLFDYFEIKLKNKKNRIISREVNQKIINSYSQMRISLNRINFLFNRIFFK